MNRTTLPFAAALASITLFSSMPTARGAAPVAPAAASTGEITAALPVIPEAKFNLMDYGAVGNYIAMDTDAFKKAIAAVQAAGGGHLIVPAGTYKTLPFTLGSHMDLHLEAGAVIKAPDTYAEYGIAEPHESPATQPDAAGGGGAGGGRGRGGGARGPGPLISCPTGTTDLAITGEGVIDGSGGMFWIYSDKTARKYPPGRTVLGRPVLVSLSGVQRLHVEGVTLTNSPMFHLVPRGSDITIENIRIVAPSDAPNSDAMDPGGQRIIIRNSEIDTGDDDVAIQQGSTDVLIENMTILHGHGISIGSGTTRGVSHMIVRNCTFDGTDNGLRIKSYRGSGGEVHDIQYSNISMKNVRRPFDINMRYNGNANTPIDVGVRDANGQTNNLPYFHDIHITNFTVVHSPIAGRIVGIPDSMPFDISFKNVKFQADRGFYVEDAKEITFENAEMNAAVGDPVVTPNATVTWNGSPKTGAGDSAPFYWGN